MSQIKHFFKTIIFKFILKKGTFYDYIIIRNFAVDPCATDNGGCTQTCANIDGAATCSCTTGTINADGLNCDPGSLYQYILY